MSNRTYRYFSGKPLFPFGHGLSYSKFHYRKASLNRSSFGAGDTVKVTFTVKNTGKFDGVEVPQVYFRHIHSAVAQPRLALCGFSRVQLKQGESTQVSLEIPVGRFRYWNTTKEQYAVEPGKYELLIGAASDDIRLRVPLEITTEQ
jgi:beta-glucosidase